MTMGNSDDENGEICLTENIYIKVEENVITGVSFKICGCVAALASASVTTVLVKGKTIDEALMITNKDISEALGGLPEQKLHCSVLGEEAIRNAVSDYRSKMTI